MLLFLIPLFYHLSTPGMLLTEAFPAPFNSMPGIFLLRPGVARGLLLEPLHSVRRRQFHAQRQHSRSGRPPAATQERERSLLQAPHPARRKTADRHVPVQGRQPARTDEWPRRAAARLA